MLVKHKKTILITTIILLIPILIPFLTTLIDIILNLGRYFGSLARTISCK